VKRKPRIPPEEIEMNPTENPQSESKPKPEPAVDLDLNGAIGAAVGEPAPEPAPPADIEAPKIQPAGNFPSFKDAFADMSKPPPAPPPQLLVLERSSTPPKGAFRVQPRQGPGLHLWMFALPYGTAMQGEAFIHPIVAALREPLMRECPALVTKRYEIRLILGANGKYALLEVPADKFSTKKAEDARQSLLKLIGLAEGGCTIGEKVPGGNWGATPALCAFPDTWPAQSLVELAASTYDPDMVTNMNNPILQRFRKQI
jgi:hypothetical protein